MEKLYNPSDAEGKTIRGWHEDTQYSDNLIITFDDNTYLFLRAVPGRHDNDPTTIQVEHGEPEAHDLLTMGAITVVQYNETRKYLAKKKEDNKAKEERQEYERLKLKFEGTEVSE